MKKQDQIPAQDDDLETTQVNIRLRRGTVKWLAAKPDKKAKTVPAKVRRMVESAQDEEEKKGG